MKQTHLQTARSRSVVAVLLVVAVLALGGCASPPEIPPNLDTYEGLAGAVAAGKDILVYDVRSAEETEAGMIPGAQSYRALV